MSIALYYFIASNYCDFLFAARLCTRYRVRALNLYASIFLSVKYLVAYVFDVRRGSVVVFAFFAYLVTRVHYGSVVAAAEVFADRHKGNALPKYVANKVNTYLTGNDNFLILLFADHILALNAEVIAGGGNNVVDCYDIGRTVGIIAQRVVDDVHIVGVAAYKRAVTDNAVKHTFHFADIVGYLFRN